MKYWAIVGVSLLLGAGWFGWHRLRDVKPPPTRPIDDRIAEPIVAAGYHPWFPPQTGIVPGSIWQLDQDGHEAPRRVMDNAIPPGQARSIPLPHIVLQQKELQNAGAMAHVMGLGLADAIKGRRLQRLEIDFGQCEVQDITPSVFTSSDFAGQWSNDYRASYGRARERTNNMVVLQAVLVSRGFKCTVSFADKATAGISVDAVNKMEGAKFNATKEASGQYSLSSSRDVVIGFLPLTEQPELAAPPPIRPPTPTKSPTATATVSIRPTIIQRSAVFVPPPVSRPVAPVAGPDRYALLWRNHFEPKVLYKVERTLEANEVRNDAFKKWCTPFDLSRKVVLSMKEAAGDEHFKGPDNWWANPPYNLPKLKKRWLEIMDDERWYVVTYRDR